ncbi:MAG: hypothetical protein ACREFO_04075 [Acetobacteraceae bacterium]
MADVDREAITSYALQRLLDPKFRRRLQATTPDGEQPIIAALPHDLLSDVWGQVHDLGDAGNVLFPLGDGFLLLAMTLTQVSDRESEAPDRLRDECTMGLFVARLMHDGGMANEVVYRVTDEVVEKGRADLVGVAE